jgi:hypothetical protein
MWAMSVAAADSVEMGASEKTIRRNLEIFRRAGFPVEETVRCARGRLTSLHLGYPPPIAIHQFRPDRQLAACLSVILCYTTAVHAALIVNRGCRPSEEAPRHRGD